MMCRILTLFFLTTVTLCFGQSTIDEATAKQKALETLSQYAELSRIYESDGNDLSKAFLDLFAKANTRIPLDFKPMQAQEVVRPVNYVAEYSTMVNRLPMPVNTLLVPKSINAREKQSSDEWVVTLLVTRSFMSDFEDGLWKLRKKPLVYNNTIEMVVAPDGKAEIISIRNVAPLVLDLWSMDLYGNQNLAAPTFTSPSAAAINGNTFGKLTVQNAGLRGQIYFNPFTSKTAKKAARLNFYAGIGFEIWRYRTEGSELVNTQNKPALAAESNQVQEEQLVPLEGNWLLTNRLPDNAEKINVGLFSARAGTQLMLRENNQSKTTLELGAGLIGGKNKEVNYTLQGENKGESINRFSNTDVFSSGNELEVSGQAISRGQYSILLDQLDPEIQANVLNTYTPLEVNQDVNETILFSSTLFVDVTLNQLFKLDSFDLGAFLTFRQHVGSPLSNYSNSSTTLNEVLTEGLPRLTAFTNQLNPTYIGLGFRIQKSR